VAYRIAALLVVVAIGASAGHRLRTSASPPAAPDAHADALPSVVWPARGQAAFVEGGRPEIQAGPNQHAAPIASLAKVMTA
jgi:hypothetical protein